MCAATDSAVNQYRFGTVAYAPTASFTLLSAAHQAAVASGKAVHVGSVFTTDTFYTEQEQDQGVKRLAEYGVLAVEMETAALYTLAAKFGTQALAVLTVSDHLLTGEQTSAIERERTFNDMIEIALTAIVAQ
jgi:purine-nucleoside phosphorylase